MNKSGFLNESLRRLAKDDQSGMKISCFTLGAGLIKKLLDGCRNDGEHIIIKVQVNDVLQTKPLCVIKAALSLLGSSRAGPST